MMEAWYGLLVSMADGDLLFGVWLQCNLPKNQVNCGIHVSLYACMSLDQLVPKTSYPGQLVPKSTRTQGIFCVI